MLEELNNVCYEAPEFRDLLGETADYHRSPAPGKQTNVCLFSLGWAPHAAT